MSTTVIKPEKVSKTAIPDRRKGGPSIERRQQIINASLEASHEDLVNLDGTDDSLVFSFTKDHDESFAKIHNTVSNAQDSCRRALRKGLDSIELPYSPRVRYEFDMERLPKGEVLCNGFTAYVFVGEEG